MGVEPQLTISVITRGIERDEFVVAGRWAFARSFDD